MEHQTAGVALWVPALVFAHAFALLWLIKALARVRPGVGERLWEKLSGKLLFWRGEEGPGGRDPGAHARAAAPSLPPHLVLCGRMRLASPAPRTDAGLRTRSQASEQPICAPQRHQAAPVGPRAAAARSVSGAAPPACQPPPAAGGAPPKARLPRPRSGDVWHADEHRVPTLLLEWEGLGCEYSTPSGPKTVLKVRAPGSNRLRDCSNVTAAVTCRIAHVHVHTRTQCSHTLICTRTTTQDVSGEARPYELLALMGPSGAGGPRVSDRGGVPWDARPAGPRGRLGTQGTLPPGAPRAARLSVRAPDLSRRLKTFQTDAGKSTLLDILAARKSVGRLTGRVAVNGAPRGSSFARHVSYVPQEDTFLPTMTVAETCALHAALTLPRGTPAAQTAERISEVLAAMGMLHASDTLVGGVLPGGLCLRGLSGGERKRVSVAVGILAAPSIIFLDGGLEGPVVVEVKGSLAV